MANIFVYGTLQNPEVVKALTGRSFKQIPYVLNNYKVFLVKGEHFPGMIKFTGSYTSGYILQDIDSKSLEVINKWEGINYAPTRMRARLTGNEIEIVAFVWTDESRLEGNWSNKMYRDTHMMECVEKCIPQEIGVSSSQRP